MNHWPVDGRYTAMSPEPSPLKSELTALPCPQQTNCWRVISSVTQPIVPRSSAAVSSTRSFQVPAVDLPLSAESGASGRNVEAKGATPAEIGCAAASSKMAGVPEQLFAPLP